jgi:hypothetical protein
MIMSPRSSEVSLVVTHDPDGGCSGSHKDTHRDTHRNTHRGTHKGTHRDDITLDSNHRQPILWFLSLAGSGCSQIRQGWVWN